jgi:opacity protein-like surface antigen
MPLSQSNGLTPFVELGVLYNTLEIGASGDGTSIEIESDASIGFEGGAGVDAALNEKVSIVPMLRYRQHEVEFEEFADGESETVQYIAISLGVRLRL